MQLSEFYNTYLSASQSKELQLALCSGNSSGAAKKVVHLLADGIEGSSRAIHIARLSESLGRTMLAIVNNAEDAEYLAADLQRLIEPQAIDSDEQKDNKKSKSSNSGSITDNSAAAQKVFLFPCSHRKRQKAADEAYEIQRTQALIALTESVNASIIVTYPQSIIETVPLRNSLSDNTIHIAVGQQIPIRKLTEQLSEMGFERVDFVYEPGQFAVRGGIFDIFSFTSEQPFRLDFFGDEIDTIRTFDIETQLSEKKIKEVNIVPAIQQQGSACGTLLDYLPADTIIVSDDLSLVHYTIINDSSDDNGNYVAAAEREQVFAPLFSDTYSSLEFSRRSYFQKYSRVSFSILPQPLFHKNFDLLASTLKDYIDKSYQIFISSDSQKQIDRIEAILNSKDMPRCFQPVDMTLHEGFVDNTAHIVFLTDHQIFERYHRVGQTAAKVRRSKALITLKELNQLRIGDYVVHVDHGIAKFGGLVVSDINGKPQEMIKLIYKNQDLLFVSIHNLHRISKYKGKEGSEPKISRLGSGQWEHIKERTKQKVKDIARDLIRLYAERRQQQGFQYSPDSYLQHELEASFLYEDTPDQQRATLDVKHDMESPVPMDRLVCGDVGFGKTEVAMRAAFKAATDGKQVAVLVPTTVLALQHYNTFTERFAQFPVRVEYISRAKSPKQVKQILDDLAAGKIDIIIGTHKLVGKSVKFKDLGLLIIDEEQKFGVATKERLRQMRVNVDTLTLTATPIPRTLQFSLLGARDLSIINTPPPNRYPIQTEVITPDDEDIIREAIELELNRNGQVFVVSNLIQSLPTIENRIRRLCPHARITTAHGQMPTDLVEQIITDFINYDYDILISTSIIESGVDIPNVNTIIINSAHRFGLSDLHQMRGRVGRTNKKAYCYLVAPSNELLTPEARRRLQAVETFAELGSGFHIAMQDLDIRGAGNMLGAEQSGFIAELGYETYQRILSEAMLELREEEDITDVSPEDIESTVWVTNTQFESDLCLNFPSDYIENISERITLYRELDSLTDERQLEQFKNRLIDRFGTLPPEAQELLQVIRLRWQAMSLGIEKVYLKASRLTVYFPQNIESPYYQSTIFDDVINFVMRNPRRCHLREQDGKRSAIIDNVKSVTEALDILRSIHPKK